MSKHETPRLSPRNVASGSARVPVVHERRPNERCQPLIARRLRRATIRVYASGVLARASSTSRHRFHTLAASPELP